MKTIQKQLATFTLSAIGFSAAIGFAQPGYAQSLGLYDFGTNASPTTAASSVNPLVVFDPFSAGSGVINGGFTTGNNKGYTATGWTTNNSFDATDYFQFALQATTGNRVNLSAITFDATRSTNGSNVGPSTIQLAYALGNNNAFSNLGLAQTVSGSSPGYSLAAVPALSQVTDKITFRLYGYSAGSATGSLDIDNVSVNGTAEAVPEPTTILGGMAALGIGRGIQRKWQRGKKKTAAV